MTTQQQVDQMKAALAAFEESLELLMDALEAERLTSVEAGNLVEDHMWAQIGRWGTTRLHRFIVACETDLSPEEKEAQENQDTAIQDAWDAHVARREAAFEAAYDAEHPGQDPCEWRA